LGERERAHIVVTLWQTSIIIGRAVQVTIRSVFGELGSYEGVLNTEINQRHLYAYALCYMYFASRTYHNALAPVAFLLPAYFIAPLKIHTELEKVLLVHVTVC